MRDCRIVCVLNGSTDTIRTVQSPIAISSHDAIIKDHMKSLKFYGHWDADGVAKIENTATTVKIRFSNRKRQPFIKGGPFRAHKRYIFDQMHFHWAANDIIGSEHTHDGKA